MRTGLLVAAASLFLGMAITTVPPEVFAQTEADVARQSRLEDLLNQRRDMLARAVELRMQQYENGDCGFEVVLATRRHLYEAEFEAATTPEDRVAALEKQVKVVETAVDFAEQMFKLGRVVQVDVLMARADLMTVEIRLMRERDMAEPKDG